MVRTLGTENGVIPQSELAAARASLSGKVIIDLGAAVCDAALRFSTIHTTTTIILLYNIHAQENYGLMC